MPPKSRAFRPGVACLEPRALMSVAQVALLDTSAITVVGKVQGRYQGGMDHRAADVPLHLKLTGNGKVQGESVKLVGSLDLGGYKLVSAPDIAGTVTLKNAKGSITLKLAGFGGPAQIPKSRLTLDATVVGGTGIYSTLHGTGTASAIFGKSTLRSKSAVGPIAGTASFSLNLDATIG